MKDSLVILLLGFLLAQVLMPAKAAYQSSEVLVAAALIASSNIFIGKMHTTSPEEIIQNTQKILQLVKTQGLN